VERRQNHDRYHSRSNEMGASFEKVNMVGRRAKTSVHGQYPILQPNSATASPSILNPVDTEDSDRRTQGGHKEVTRSIEVKHEETTRIPLKAHRTL